MTDPNKIVTASSQHASWADKDNAFDSNVSSQWVVSTADKNGPGWIKVQYTSSHSIYKIELTGRQPPQDKIQYVTKWTLDGSNDDVTYDYIFSMTENIFSTHSREFKVTRPYQYFKLSLEGKGQYGLSDVKLYPATIVNEGYKNMSTLLQGNIPFVSVSSNGKPVINSTTKLTLDTQGILGSNTGYIEIGRPLDMNLNLINKLGHPVNSDDATTKQYVDNGLDNLFNVLFKNTPALTQGNIPFVALDVNNKPIINSSSNLMIDNQGFIFTNSGSIKFGREVDVNFNTIKNVNFPSNVDDAANKQYVDMNTSYVLGGGLTRKSNSGLELESNVYRHSTTLAPNFIKFLPVAGYDQGTSNYRISGSTFTVPDKFQRPTLTTDVTDKQYVDALTAYKQTGGLTRSSGGGLEVTSDVLRLVSPMTIPPYTNGFLPMLALNMTTNVENIGKSKFTVSSGTAPVVSSDVVNKNYVDSNFLGLPDFNVYKALPGIPVSSGLVMMFVPTLSNCNPIHPRKIRESPELLRFLHRLHNCPKIRELLDDQSPQPH